MLIVLEGVDSCGKDTQADLLSKKLGAGRVGFPSYKSQTGNLILQHLKKLWHAEALAGADVPSQKYLNDLIFQSLQTVNRLEMLPEINACIERGQHLVSARYWQSACVYGVLDGLDEAWLRLVQEKPMPSATINILIDVPIAEGFARRPERRDRYETNRPFLEKVRMEYLRLWDTQAQLFPASESWHVVDGIGTIAEVHARIMDIVSAVPIG